jgi:citrate lyase subunit beta / citryl-CoA lyase
MTIQPRSWLFVPGDSDKKLSKIAYCGADAVIIDLEDSVAPDNKTAARRITADFVARNRNGAAQLWVRVNPLDSGLCQDDVAAIAGHAPHGLVLPKCEGPEDVDRLAALIDAAGGSAAIAIHAIATETPRAIFRLTGFADRTPARLSAISWGAEDLATAIGASGNRHADGGFHDAFRHARTLALFAAHAAGVQAVDTLYADFRDEAGLRQTSELARAEGFTGRLAIHPAQVAVINAAFLPSAAEIDHARRIVDAFAAAGDVGTVGLDGRMIDRPHLVQSQRILARHTAFAGV